MKKILLTLTLLMACLTNANAGTYRGFFDITPKFPYYDLELTTTHGWQFNSKLYLGAGTGLIDVLCGEALDDSDNTTAIPIFVKFRVDNLCEKRWTPFGEIKTGIYKEIFDAADFGLYLVLQGGVRYALAERLGLNCGLGFSVTSSSSMFTFNIGIDF